MALASSSSVMPTFVLAMSVRMPTSLSAAPMRIHAISSSDFMTRSLM